MKFQKRELFLAHPVVVMSKDVSKNSFCSLLKVTRIKEVRRKPRLKLLSYENLGVKHFGEQLENFFCLNRILGNITGILQMVSNCCLALFLIHGFEENRFHSSQLQRDKHKVYLKSRHCTAKF